MNQQKNIYSELNGKSREQITQLASQEVKRVLADVNLSHYRDIQVWKTSKYIRVRFAANISVAEQEVYEKSEGLIRSPGVVSNIEFISFENKIDARPKESKYLFQYSNEILDIAKTFDVRDNLSFKDLGETFRVRASHPSTLNSSGGSEVYLIHKKTLHRDMIQHEHPQPFEDSGTITDKLGNPYVDPDPEIEMPDPALELGE